MVNYDVWRENGGNRWNSIESMCVNEGEMLAC